MWGIYDFYMQPFWMVVVFVVLGVWTLVWKGIGLWHTARNKQKVWFVCILIFNTLGILPIVYLIFFKPGNTRVSVKEEVKAALSESRRSVKKIVKKKRR